MFLYFGYGSNMDFTSLRAKGVVPRRSDRAVLEGWRLRFNVHHWFKHEGGVGNIERTEEAGARVLGVVHECDDADLERMDQVESRGVGYDRAPVHVRTAEGVREAVAYVGLPGYLDESCRPTRRYLNILVRGAEAAGLDEDYVQFLRSHPVHEPGPYPPFDPRDTGLVFDRHSLGAHPTYTAVAGAVFDMTGARWQHDCLRELFGGKDTTVFHLRRHDDSVGTETEADVVAGRLTEGQREYLNAYAHEYAREYTYVGRYLYSEA